MHVVIGTLSKEQFDVYHQIVFKNCFSEPFSKTVTKQGHVYLDISTLGFCF